jgi:hypothetical protein
MTLASERGYNAAKRRQKDILPLAEDEYSLWQTANQIPVHTCKSMVAALLAESKTCPVDQIKDTMMNMAKLLTMNPIVAQNIAHRYQQDMKEHYAQAFRPAAVQPKKKLKT